MHLQGIIARSYIPSVLDWVFAVMNNTTTYHDSLRAPLVEGPRHWDNGACFFANNRVMCQQAICSVSYTGEREDGTIKTATTSMDALRMK